MSRTKADAPKNASDGEKSQDDGTRADVPSARSFCSKEKLWKGRSSYWRHPLPDLPVRCRDDTPRTSSKKGAPEGAFLLGQHAFLEDDLSGELHAARVAGEDSLLVIEAGAVDGDEAAVPG